MSGEPVLNLTHLYLDRLPGIETPFSVPAEPGVNLVIGPNEVGKSSLARSVLQLLWPDSQAVSPTSVRGEFRDAVGPLQARRQDNEPVIWTRKGEPATAPDLPGGHVVRCYRLGLLDLNRREAGDLDGQLAREIRRQMAGGFDLAQVRELFPDHGKKLSRRKRTWNEACQDLQKCQNRQKQLAAQERGLAAQEAAKTRALLAGRRVNQLVAALEYLALNAREAELQTKLAELPPNMDKVRAGDGETLAELQERIREKTDHVHDLRAEIRRRADHLDQLAITGDLVELAQVVKQAESLAARTQESARAEAAAAAAVEDARVDLDPALLAAEIPAESQDAFERLAAAHRELVTRQARADHLDRLLDLEMLRETDAAAGPSAVTPEAQELLVSARLNRPGPGLLIGGMLALAGAGILFGTEANRSLGGPAALAVFGLGNLGLWLHARRSHQQDCRRLEDLNRAGVDSAIRRTRGELRAELQRQREAVQEDLHAAAAERRNLLRELGQSEHRADPGLLQNLDRVARCRTAENQHAGELGRHRYNQSALAEVFSEGRKRLAAMGLEVEPSVVALSAGLQKLNECRTQAAGLAETQARDQSSLRQAQRELATATASSEGLRQRLALPQDKSETAALDQVTVRVAALPDYENLMLDLKTVRRDFAAVGGRIDGGDDLPPASAVRALSADELVQRLDEQRLLASEATNLTEEIARIKDRINTARGGDEWEQARARAAEKADDLADLLDEQREGVLGRLLLGTIEKRHEIDTQPPLLEEMNRHLRLFTAGRYRLRVTGDGDRGDSQRFVAIDNTDRTLELTELSDGTRAQLLLAARLAFLTQTEDGARPPLFLDEALTASDPLRFDAIAGAVGELAAGTGRQVFYLTSNPADLAAWQRALADRNLPPAHVIDLAQRRALAVGATETELALPNLPQVPRPDGRTAPDYGARLKVPALRPWAHENDVHLFHLWKDDLELVYRLLVGGLPTLGQWRQLGSELVRAGMLDTDRAARIDARGEVYGAFLDAWRIGRDRPVTRQDLAASEALSPAMLTLADDLLTSVGGQGGPFMAAILDGQVKRLNRAKKEALQDYLERHGHLDNRVVWEPDQIVAHVLGAVFKPLAAKVLSPDEVRRLVLDLHRNSGQATAAANSRSAESDPTG